MRLLSFVVFALLGAFLMVALVRPEVIKVVHFAEKEMFSVLALFILHGSVFVYTDNSICLIKAHSREMKRHYMTNKKYAILTLFISIALLVLIQFFYPIN